MIRVAFQGEHGAYSEAALLAYFGEGVEPLPCLSFEEAFAVVERGDASHAMLPLENTLGGSIHRNYDLLLRHSLHIVGEWHQPIRHQLMALPGVRVQDLRTVWSHPQALAQCEHTLDRMGLAREPAYDTAGAAKMVRDQARTDVAAIASRHAAEVYGLEILARDVEDEADNLTRFVAVAAAPAVIDVGVPAKCSIVFSLDNRPGALFKALSVFALRDLDLTKLESRPLRGRRWEYLFYLDVALDAGEPALQRALTHLEEITTFKRLLGIYPRHLEGAA